MFTRSMGQNWPLGAERKNPSGAKATVSDDDKFQFKDIFSFKISFWLLTVSCVVTYASVFPYIQVCSDMLQTKYSMDKDKANALFGIPYLISACASPFLGFLIDKVGRRVQFIILSSAVLIVAFAISMQLEPCDDGCTRELVPLCMVGVAYSIYAAAIWGSIPYVVSP